MSPDDPRELARSIRSGVGIEVTEADVAALRDLLGDDRRLALNALRVVASRKPGLFRLTFADPAPVRSLRRDPDATVRADAAALLAATIEPEADPEEIKETLATLESLLGDESRLVRRTALEGVDRATALAPETAPTLADDVVPVLDDGGESRRRAIDVLARAVTIDGESVAPHAARIAELCRAGDGYEGENAASTTAPSPKDNREAAERISQNDGTRLKRHRTIRGRAAYVVRQLAISDPDALIGGVDEVAAALEDPDPGARGSLAETFVILAQHRPSAVAPHRRLLGEILAEGRPSAAEPATRALAALGVTEPTVADVAIERVDALREHLDSEEASVRGASAALLALAAEADPETIVPVEPALVELLTDEDDAVRVAAADALRAGEPEGPGRRPTG